jgi:transketolase
MKIDPTNPKWMERDRLVLSKGHTGPGLYAALGVKGYFPKEWLKTVNKPGTNLPSHCDMNRTPGIDMTTGSLGQGISAAVGIALGCRLRGIDNYTYCIIGDGETQEGQVWEAVQSAAHLKLNNFILFVDDNKKQLDGFVTDICEPLDFEQKFRAFGWDARTAVGYDVESIYDAILSAKKVTDKPAVIILDTWKGLGVSFAENMVFNHYMVISDEMADSACDEVEKRYKENSYPKGDCRW